MLSSSNRVFVSGEAARSWGQRLEDAEQRFGEIEPLISKSRVLFLVGDPAQAFEALVFALDRQLDSGVLEASRLTPEMAEALDRLGIGRVTVDDGAVTGIAGSSDFKPGRLTVMTSGTTGRPKAIEHGWHTLNTLARVKNNSPRFWFVPYQIGSYAWYQMMCLGLFKPDQDLYCTNSSDPMTDFALALQHGVTAISSTPTFWRYAFLTLEDSVFRSARLDSITLGGEIVDQAILDQLAEKFPGAAIRHIYASSEAGAAIVVTDGHAGFPTTMLGEHRPDIAIKVDGGRLFVRSSFTTAAAIGKPSEWIDTGDLVQIKGDRVCFLGREQSAMLNIGGLKAFPAEIEARLLEHPNVHWAQVSSRRAPLVGTLPAARVVLHRPARNTANAEAELSAFLLSALPAHAVPRFWEFLDRVPLKASLKS